MACETASPLQPLSAKATGPLLVKPHLTQNEMLNLQPRRSRDIGEISCFSRPIGKERVLHALYAGQSRLLVILACFIETSQPSLGLAGRLSCRGRRMGPTWPRLSNLLTGQWCCLRRRAIAGCISTSVLHHLLICGSGRPKSSSGRRRNIKIAKMFTSSSRNKSYRDSFSHRAGKATSKRQKSFKEYPTKRISTYQPVQQSSAQSSPTRTGSAPTSPYVNQHYPCVTSLTEVLAISTQPSSP